MFGEQGENSAFKELVDILGRGFGLTKGQHTFAVFLTALLGVRVFGAAGPTCAGDGRRVIDRNFGFFGSSGFARRHGDGSGGGCSQGSSG